MDGQHEIFDSLEPDPLDREQVIEGDPQTYDLLLSESPDGTEVSGFWMCTPGTFSDTELEESFLVIRGSAEVEFADGTRLSLAPGDTHSFTAGEKTIWKVTTPLLKSYWARTSTTK
jgi:uncharacterized cupin superfamily protein